MPRPTYRKYEHQALLEAVEKMKNKDMKAKEASCVYAVPRVTILDRVYNRVKMDTSASGPQSVLTSTEEGLLKDWVVGMAKASFPITKELLKISVKIFSTRMGVPTLSRTTFQVCIHILFNIFDN
jgi:hypothetical protein